MNAQDLGDGNACQELTWFLAQARAAKRRSMREFAESEVVIPDGPFEGRRFRCSRQPYTGLWLDAVDSGCWSRFVATGPTQSGKTLACFVIPLLYHLFEVGETVICGLPDMDMAADKWREDILPAIERSQFRELLPTRGGGSRGGRIESIQFLNGATLKFMSGGGGDKSRAGFTSRVVVITETDGMDEAGAASRESDKITQLEARTRAYGVRKRIYMECTVSTEQGRTWREYNEGTRSRILLPCPHCRQWVAPEREHLVGWQDAESQLEARNRGHFVCPGCEEPWSPPERIEANSTVRLIHDGQEIDEDGGVRGQPPASDTLGFRWSAVHNLFLDEGDFAADEWRASRAADEDNAERELRQFVWCVPVAPNKWDETALEVHSLASRTSKWARGVVPDGAEHLTAAIDLGKYRCHWAVVAWREGATGHVVDYGVLEVASEELGVEQGLMAALRQFREKAVGGWRQDDKPLMPNWIVIDAGYMTEVVYQFCRESQRELKHQRFLPAVGRGVTQQRSKPKPKQTTTGSTVTHMGEGFHISHLKNRRCHLVEVDADHWKTWVHQRLSTPLEKSGAMTLFDAPPQSHLGFARHLTAETKVEEFVAGKGVVVRWERVRRQNHWLDALYNASAAGHLAGARLIVAKPAEPPPNSPRRENRKPWIDTERWRRIRRW